jgi:peptidoglycan/xylan/chitin deacetylase (PgdA/CDA1 family)
MGPLRLSLAALTCGSMLTACSVGSQVAAMPQAYVSPPAQASASPSATATPSVTGAATGANELGEIPVVMYHQIIARPGRDDTTPDQFRAELAMLYHRGFRPIRATDLVAGRIDVPAGMHPVVLTFDDSTVSQARIGADGEPMPDTALGVLTAFGREHPDFRPTATFFINTYPPAFVDDKVMPWLVEHGYEIAAHTRSHADLHHLSAAGVQNEIGANIAEMQAAVPGYPVTTLAYPYGLRPIDHALALRGVYQGADYCLTGAFGVDEIAAHPPYWAKFDAGWIPRVGTTDADNLFQSLRLHPERLYVSDGDPTTISFPPDEQAQFNPNWRSTNPHC